MRRAAAPAAQYTSELQEESVSHSHLQSPKQITIIIIMHTDSANKQKDEKL